MPEGDQMGGTIFESSSNGDPLFKRLDIAANLTAHLAEWPREACLIYPDASRQSVLVAPIEEILTVGRAAPARVVVSSQHMTRAHFEITRVGEEFEIRDLNSRNGTYVNGRRWDLKPVLDDGDCVEAGGVVFVFLKGA
jgi:hypothetical protein